MWKRRAGYNLCLFTVREQMRFYCLLWEFGSLLDLWKGFVPAVMSESHIQHLTFFLLQLFIGKHNV